MEVVQRKSGRKPTDGEVRNSKITIKVTEEELARIEEMAKYIDIPKTVAVRNFVLITLEDMERLKRVGLLQIAKGIIKTSDWIKAIKRQQTRIDFEESSNT